MDQIWIRISSQVKTSRLMSPASVPSAVSQLCGGGGEGRLQRVRVARRHSNLDGAAPRVDLLLYANLDKRENSMRY